MLHFFALFLGCLFVVHGQAVILVIKNETGKEFTELYVFSQEMAGQEKEKNILSQQACLVWQEGHSVSMPLQGQGPWTICGIDSDGEEVYWRNIYASSERSFVLKWFAGQSEVLEREP